MRRSLSPAVLLTAAALSLAAPLSGPNARAAASTMNATPHRVFVRGAWEPENSTGIYRDPAGGIGACVTPDGKLAAGRYRQDRTVYGSAGTWAWEFVVSRASPSGATWPPKQIRVAGPLARLHDRGSNAGAAIDQAANIVDPHENFQHAKLDHTGEIGRQLAAFAKAYPGPWSVRTKLSTDRILVAGRRYAGAVSVIASNGKRVPVTGLPVSVASTDSSKVTLSSRLTTQGADRFTVTPSRAGRFRARVRVRDLAPATARLMSPVGGRASGYQYLLQAGSVRARAASLAGRARPAGYRLALQKVSLETGKPLAGAVFEVMDLTTHQDIGDVTTKAQPVQIRDRYTSTGELDDSHRYEVIEIKAPFGYYIPSDHSRVIDPRRGRNAITVKLADPVIPRPMLQTRLLPSAGSSGPQTVSSGNRISDSISVTGDDGENGTIAATLEAVRAPASGVCSSAPFAHATTLARSTIEINGSVDGGNGDYTTPAVKLAGSGECASWVESLTLPTSGATATTTPGEPAESVLVISPAFTTRASAHRITSGHRIHDQVSVTGAYGRSVEISGSLLGPLTPVHGSCRAARWGRAPSAETISPTTFKGDGTFRLGSYKLPADAGGCYTFVEALTPMTNLGRTSVKRSARGLPGESLLVLHPTIRTLSQHALAGHRLRDRVRVSGLFGADASISARLLETAAADGECKRVDWRGARTVGSTSARIDGDGIYLTRALGPVRLLHGRSTCTSFVDTITVNGRKLLMTRPGIASETEVMRPRLEIVTGLGPSDGVTPLVRMLSVLALTLLGIACLAGGRLGAGVFKHHQN